MPYKTPTVFPVLLGTVAFVGLLLLACSDLAYRVSKNRAAIDRIERLSPPREDERPGQSAKDQYRHPAGKMEYVRDPIHIDTDDER